MRRAGLIGAARCGATGPRECPALIHIKGPVVPGTPEKIPLSVA